MLQCKNSILVLLPKCAKQLLLIRPQSRIIIMSSVGGSPIMIAHKFTISSLKKKKPGCLPVKIWQEKKKKKSLPILLACHQLSRWSPANAGQCVNGRNDTKAKKTYQMWLFYWIIDQWTMNGLIRRFRPHQDYSGESLCLYLKKKVL